MKMILSAGFAAAAGFDAAPSPRRAPRVSRAPRAPRERKLSGLCDLGGANLVVWVCLIVWLSACSAAVPTQTPLPPTPSPTSQPTETPAPTPIPTSAASAIALNCEDEASITIGEYQAQNNTWGKGDLSGWSQCIGVELSPAGTLAGRWKWDWLDTGGGVKAYPEIIFGQKPGSAASTSAALPVKLRDLRAAVISYEVDSNYTGGGNLTFDLWLTNTPNPSTWGAPPITHEIMIWLESHGGLNPGGVQMDLISIGGAKYAVYLGDDFGDGWRYIAFNSVKSQVGVGTLDLADFLAYLQEKNLATGDEYLASIEFGNEVVRGAGETLLHQYQVAIQTK